MDEHQRENGGTPPKKRRKRAHSRIFAGVVLVVLCAAAVLCFLYRDKLSADGLRSLFGRTVEQETDTMRDWNYETGANQVFARVGNGLAAASSSTMQLIDENGVTVFHEICSMDSPAISANDSAALFYDVGGSVCRLAFQDGTGRTLDAGGTIISASLNSGGYCAVIAEEAGVKGVVRVYDAAGAPVYEWYSGTGYAVRASVSPDSRHLAVLCLTGEGSFIHIFRLTSEEELALVSAPGEVYYDMEFTDTAKLCAVGSGGLLFFTLDGETLLSYDFGGRFLNAYDFGSGFAAVHLCDYRTGTAGEAIAFSPDGETLGSLRTERVVTSMSVCGKRLLLAGPDGLELYSQTLALQSQRDMLVTAKAALLRPKGDVLLLSSYAAERVTF